MKEMITVTYTATKEYAANKVRMDIVAAGEDVTREKACATCLANCDALKEKLSNIDVKLSTGMMSVSPKYKDNTAVAFRALQTFSTEFDYDVELLNGVIDALTAVCVEWRASYKLKSGNKERDKLIAQAVDGARAAAKTIADAAGVGLGKLVKVDYASGDSAAPVMFRAMRAVDTDVAPEPIKLSETVVCGWEID